MTNENQEEQKKHSEIIRNVLFYYEGLLDYCQERGRYDDTRDPRRVGWNLGRQVIAQHLTEIALKGELAKYVDKIPKHHNLKALFERLPWRRRQKAEALYKRILGCKVPRTWDVFRTINSFLTFLGKNPSVETRYFWEEESRSNQLGVGYFSNLISPDSYVHLVYALLIAFHGYPTKQMIHRYETQFDSLRESVLKDK